MTSVCLQSRVSTSACRSPTPDIRISTTFVPQHVKEAMTSKDGPPKLTESTRHVIGETLARWVLSLDLPHGRIVVMFGPVITAEAHLAFSGGRNALQ